MTAEQVAPLLATALARSSHEGARIVALHWLHALSAARQRWSDLVDAQTTIDVPAATRPSAADTLHQARVALRRLRATLREHRTSLSLNEGARIRRSLRKLGKATNAVRDIDVQRAWLEAEHDALPAPAQEEARAMLLELEDEARASRAVVSRAFERNCDPCIARLANRLSHYWLPQTVGTEGQSVPFAGHLATRVERASAHLRHDLGLVRDVRSQRVLHRIRIRLKRQRAMLAPFARAHPAIGAWYAMATEGQDLLGAMRDASLLSSRAHRRDFDALAKSLRASALSHFQAFHERWCGEADAVSRARTNAVQALRAIADGRGPRSPAGSALGVAGLPLVHGLPMEIERKFLLHGLPPQAAMTPSNRIEQGWLPGTILRERLRRSIAPNGDERLTRTIKLGQPGERIEVEEPTEPTLFAAMWPLTVEARIRKRRHAVREGVLTWEIDVFLDRDLVLAEVELDDVAQPIDIPDWLAPFIVREVTHETAYLNSVMAQRDVASPDRGAH